MDIELNFINRSEDGQRSEVVLFQKNVELDMNELPMAWKVIRHCGRDCSHPLRYPLGFDVCVSDDHGNFSPRLATVNGQLLSITPTASGRRLGLKGDATSTTEVQVLNELPRGGINAHLFKDGRLLVSKTGVAPQQKAVFQLKPTIWIGTASQVVQGRALSSAVVSQVNTELSLLGIASADIVMTGGGGGPNAAPYAFALDNVVRA